jgi:Ni2+-binding GTPase involved in maturation of urease and hydrogenase
MSKARYILIGGFLGAGKTTAILKLAEHLKAQHQRVGLITNDQAGGLVDTARARAAQWPVEEIAGGCFCCRFPSLIDASQKLAASAHPEVFLAEPVGSCTDLVATVAFPLRQMYGADWLIAPFSVVVDPVRAARVLGLETGAQFSEKVVYIYRKQLEEADLIVINKCDLLADARRAALRAALAKQFPRAEIFECSARTGAGLDAWFTRITTAEIGPRVAMDVDYQLYGQGEALMGWLNATLQVSAPKAFDGNLLLTDFAGRLRGQLQNAKAEVAHLKMTLAPGPNPLAIGAVSLVRNDQQPELTHSLLDPLASGELTLNLRAEAAPELLEHVVRRVAAGWLGIKLDVTKLASFRPGQPNPTHRIANPV